MIQTITFDHCNCTVTSFLRDCAKPKLRNSRGTDSLGKSRTSPRNRVKKIREIGAVHGKRGCAVGTLWAHGSEDFKNSCWLSSLRWKWLQMNSNEFKWTHIGNPELQLLFAPSAGSMCASALCLLKSVTLLADSISNNFTQRNDCGRCFFCWLWREFLDCTHESSANSRFWVGGSTRLKLKPSFGYPEGLPFYYYWTLMYKFKKTWEVGNENQRSLFARAYVSPVSRAIYFSPSLWMASYHSYLTKETGPTGNRYPTVTLLPYGTPSKTILSGRPKRKYFRGFWTFWQPPPHTPYSHFARE